MTDVETFYLLLMGGALLNIKRAFDVGNYRKDLLLLFLRDKERNVEGRGHLDRYGWHWHWD